MSTFSTDTISASNSQFLDIGTYLSLLGLGHQVVKIVVPKYIHIWSIYPYARPLSKTAKKIKPTKNRLKVQNTFKKSHFDIKFRKLYFYNSEIKGNVHIVQDVKIKL